MKAVFEEVNGNQAVFVLDDIPKIFHLDASLLPADARLGDVFQVYVVADRFVLGEKLVVERERRELSAKEKRAQLLKRKRKE